ncbi:MAG: hypothetical protein ACYTG6_11005 [Planctomycetota bacterium]|jgi:hypothetical protein
MLRNRIAAAGAVFLLLSALSAGASFGEDENCHRLDMEVQCAVLNPKVLVGDPFTATARVTNTGDTPLSNVTLALRGRSGVQQVGNEQLQLLIEKLEPGETRDIRGTFKSDGVGERRIDASAREERGWAAAGCFCGVLVEGLPALQLEMIDENIRREKEGVFEEGENFIYVLVVENDMGTAITPDLKVTWDLPEHLEFVSGTGDRGVTVSGSGQQAESSDFVLAPEEVQRFELVCKVLSVPPRHLVQTRASVLTTGGQELATETESTTLRPPTQR